MIPCREKERDRECYRGEKDIQRDRERDRISCHSEGLRKRGRKRRRRKESHHVERLSMLFPHLSGT